MRKNTHTRWQAATPGVPDRLNLMGIRFMSAGEGGDAGTGGQDGAGSQGEQQAPTPTPGDLAAKATAAQQQQTETGNQSGDNLPDDPAALKAEIARLRKENAGDRTAAKTKAAEDAQAALTQQIGKALGLIKDDETPDPAALTAQLTEQQATARQAQLELAVFKNAGAKNADPSALLDSRSFLDSVKDIDPTDTAAITAAIEKAVTANQKLKAVQAAASNSANHAGGSGEKGTKPTSLQAAVANHYNG
ncbi:hypothetical protein SAMN06309944_0246 [Micrococcales bacterium KH10]|nr:hypothetical protein SAMN06309944_0246 [Micrococcales bacterium KH10]